MNKSVVLTGIGVVVALGAVGGGLAYWQYRKLHAPAPPAMVQVETVDIATAATTQWRAEADLVGTVIAIESVTLSNEVPGTVSEVDFKSGEIVEKGQVLLTLDTSTEQAELRAAEASIQSSKAALEAMESNQRLAAANLERVKQAAEANAAAAMDVDERKNAAETAKADMARMAAQIDQAQAMADRMKTVIAKKTLRAPFKAHAGLRNIHPGQYLKEGTEIVSLESVSDDIYLDFALPQEQAWRAHPGDVVMASSNVLGDKPVEVRIVALDAEANPDTRNVRVRTVISNAAGTLRPGMFVQMRVPVGEAQPVVTVPITAVRRASYGDHVFVISTEKPKPQPGMPVDPNAPQDPPGTLYAHQRFVTVGSRIGEDVVITKGLSAGERVAAAGSFKLREGVQVREPPPSTPASVTSGSDQGKEPTVAAHD